MGFYVTEQLPQADVSRLRRQVKPETPLKKSRLEFFSSSRFRAGFSVSQPVETHWETEPTPTIIVSGMSCWLSRNLIGEEGVNLYEFVNNAPGNLVDILGMKVVQDWSAVDALVWFLRRSGESVTVVGQPFLDAVRRALKSPVDEMQALNDRVDKKIKSLCCTKKETSWTELWVDTAVQGVNMGPNHWLAFGRIYHPKVIIRCNVSKVPSPCHWNCREIWFGEDRYHWTAIGTPYDIDWSFIEYHDGSL